MTKKAREPPTHHLHPPRRSERFTTTTLTSQSVISEQNALQTLYLHEPRRTVRRRPLHQQVTPLLHRVNPRREVIHLCNCWTARRRRSGSISLHELALGRRR